MKQKIMQKRTTKKMGKKGKFLKSKKLNSLH
jgi:hypothetical protein